MRSAQGYLHLARTHLQYDCNNSKIVEAKRIPSALLYEINKIPVYSLHVRDDPTYNRYLSSSGIVDQIDCIVIIIADVSVSDNAVPVL